MNGTENSNVQNETLTRFPSLASLRAVHRDLLKRRGTEEGTPRFLSEVSDFIRKGRSTGSLLDDDEDRAAAQSLLDYWSNDLYRAGQEPPDASLAGFDPNLAPELDDALCPYLGLRAFQEKDRKFFFGRQKLIETLIGRLRENSFLAVVGPSGSGKSSLVLAGLLPRLRAGALEGSQNWRYLEPMMPGTKPLENLARLIQPSDVKDPQWIQTQVTSFQADTGHLCKLIREQGETVLIIVDQFEELFTLCRDEAIRQVFVENFLDLIETPDARHRVILTMRTDFETYVARLPRLQPLFQQAQERVTPLSASELREAIEKPAGSIGLKFEQGLVDALLQDILGEPAGLPLLQFSLLKLWENRQRNRVMWETYRKSGGGRLALARSADAFYFEELIPEEQVTAKRILLRLVRPGEGMEVTRNRVRRATLYHTGEARERVDRVLDQLIEAHLVNQTGETSEDAQVEVVHEALVRNWPTLVGWLDEERVHIRQRLRLTAAAEQWDTRGRDPGVLLRGSLLEEAQHYEDLNDLEKEFIQASQAAVEEVERKKEAARQRELEAARKLAKEEEARRKAEERARHEAEERAEEQTRAASRLRQRALALAVVVVLAMGTAVFAFIQQQKAIMQRELAVKARQEAEAARQEAEALRKKAEEAEKETKHQLVTNYWINGVNERDRNNNLLKASHYFMKASTLAASAGEHAFSRKAQLAGDMLVRNLQLDAILEHKDSVEGATLSHDERWILTWSTDGTAQVWDSVTGKPLADSMTHKEKVNGAVFSQNADWILTWSVDGTAQVWDRVTGKALASPLKHNSSVLGAVFSQDEGQVLTWSSDRTARIWDRVTGKALIPPLQHNSSVLGAVFNQDERRVLTWSADGTARLWDSAKGNALIPPLEHKGLIEGTLFSQDEDWILTWSSDGTARLWDSVTGEALASPLKHQSSVNGAVFSQDERRVLTWSSDGTARVWDSTSGLPLTSPMEHIASVLGAVFSQDERRVLTWSSDGTARVWDSTSGLPLTPSLMHSASVYGAIFNHDEHWILTWSADGTARVWDSTSGLPLTPPMEHTASVLGAGFSRDERWILTWSSDGTSRMWDSITGKALTSPLVHTASVNGTMLSQDEHRVLTWSADGTARMWNNVSLPTPPLLHKHEVLGAMFSQDEHRVLTWSSDGTARVWDSATGKALNPPLLHKSEVLGAVFSQDERTSAHLECRWHGAAMGQYERQFPYPSIKAQSFA